MASSPWSSTRSPTTMSCSGPCRPTRRAPASRRCSRCAASTGSASAPCDCLPPRGAPLARAAGTPSRRRRGRAGGGTTLTSCCGTRRRRRAAAAGADYVIHDLARGVLCPATTADGRRTAVSSTVATRRDGCCGPTRASNASSVGKHPRREGGTYRNAAWKEHVTQLHGKNLKGDWHTSSRALAAERPPPLAGHHRRRAAGGGAIRAADLDGVAHLQPVDAAAGNPPRPRPGPHGFTAKEAGTFVLDARREPPRR